MHISWGCNNSPQDKSINNCSWIEVAAGPVDIKNPEGMKETDVKFTNTNNWITVPTLGNDKHCKNGNCHTVNLQCYYEKTNFRSVIWISGNDKLESCQGKLTQLSFLTHFSKKKATKKGGKSKAALSQPTPITADQVSSYLQTFRPSQASASSQEEPKKRKLDQRELRDLRRAQPFETPVRRAPRSFAITGSWYVKNASNGKRKYLCWQHYSHFEQVFLHFNSERSKNEHQYRIIDASQHLQVYEGELEMVFLEVDVKDRNTSFAKALWRDFNAQKSDERFALCETTDEFLGTLWIA